MVVNQFDSDTLSISFSGTFDYDNESDPEWMKAMFGVKPDWSTNHGSPVDWIADDLDPNSPGVEVTSTLHIYDRLLNFIYVRADNPPHGDVLWWGGGAAYPIGFGVPISGTVTISGSGIFDPSTITNFSLVHGYVPYQWDVHEVTVPAIDSDGDGIADSEDNCPAIANTDQEPSELEPGRGVACEGLPPGC
jgi:hypothetical protein